MALYTELQADNNNYLSKCKGPIITCSKIASTTKAHTVSTLAVYTLHQFHTFPCLTDVFSE